MTVLERANARALAPADLPYAPDLIVADVSFNLARQGLPAVLAAAAPRFDALVMVKPQFEVGREKVGKGGVVRDEADRRAAIDGVAAAATTLGAVVLGEASSGLPGPKGNLETFLWLAGGRAPRGRRMTPCRTAIVVTHSARSRPPTPSASWRWRRRATASRCASTTTRRPSTASSRATASWSGPVDAADIDLCVVLGGDGTILSALRRFAGTRRARGSR